MNSESRASQLKAQSIRLRTSFDCLIQKVSLPVQNTPIRLQRFNFSKGKPYKFPEYQDSLGTCYSPSLYESPQKKNVFRIEKINKLQNILLQKNRKFKKALSTSYKSQKTQRFQKTMVAFQDLQQIDSINIRRFKHESQEMIRLKEAQRIHELLENKKQNSTVFVRKDDIGTKNRIRLKDSFRRPFFEQNPYNTLSLNSKKYGHSKNLSPRDCLNKTSSFFSEMDENEKIDGWNVSPEYEIGLA